MATVEELKADLVEVRAARLALAKGERVDEVWRDGRRLVLGKVTLDSLNKLIEQLERDIEQTEAEAAGKPRRRPIGLAWRN